MSARHALARSRSLSLATLLCAALLLLSSARAKAKAAAASINNAESATAVITKRLAAFAGKIAAATRQVVGEMTSQLPPPLKIEVQSFK
jgi:hypothetical protein